MIDSPPRVFTIPASAPFVPTLIDALLDGTLVEGFPARRSARARRRDALSADAARLPAGARRVPRRHRGDAAILPRIVPIGDIDEDEIAFADAADAGALDLPDALDGLERRLLLARLVAWAASQAPPRRQAPLVANNPAAALALADELARLMDDMTTRQVPWDRLDTWCPASSTTTGSSRSIPEQIAREAWPAILAERGAIEPAARRDLLIAAEAERLAAATDGPVIAAGSTGSMPATAALIATIAKLPHGAVVLPGLDTDLDAESWDLIAGRRDADGTRDRSRPPIGHPQFAMQALLRRIGIARDEVGGSARRPRTARGCRLGGAAAGRRHRPLARAARAAISARRPRWSTYRSIEAANAEEEALAIAVALREAVETEARPRRWSRPTARSRAACWPRSRAGTSRSTIPAATRSPTRRPACSRGLRPKPRSGARAGDAARAAQASAAAARRAAKARMRAPSRRWSAPCCAARGRGRARGGLAHALETFRAELREAAPRRSAHALTTELQAAADLVVALAAALGPLEACRAKQPLAARRPRIAHVIDALSNERRGVCGGLRRPRRQRRWRSVRRDRRQPAGRRRGRRSRTIPTCSAPSSPRRCAGPTGPARACASTVRSKRACKASTASCWAGWSKASGRRRRAAIPGSAGRCATRSASTCRSGASRFPPTTSRRCSARRR